MGKILISLLNWHARLWLAHSCWIKSQSMGAVFSFTYGMFLKIPTLYSMFRGHKVRPKINHKGSVNMLSKMHLQMQDASNTHGANAQLHPHDRFPVENLLHHIVLRLELMSPINTVFIEMILLCSGRHCSIYLRYAGIIIWASLSE